MKTYTGLRNQYGKLTNNTSTANLTLGDELINDSLRYLTTKYFFNERTQVIPNGTVASQQAYNLPYNIKTLINAYITVGDIRYQLKEVPNRTFWDSLNFVPYTSDIPQYYYIFNKKIYVFPTPASSSNVFTIVYKIRLKDLSAADYSTGTVTFTNGDATVVGSGTAFTSAMVGRWIQDDVGEWYEIASVTDGTNLELVNEYEGVTNAGTATLIGDVPLLPEDYQDLPVYRACSIYYTSRVPDPERASLFKQLYNEGFERLDAEFGSKTHSVAITPADTEVINPNLFVRNLS